MKATAPWSPEMVPPSTTTSPVIMVRARSGSTQNHDSSVALALVGSENVTVINGPAHWPQIETPEQVAELV